MLTLLVHVIMLSYDITKKVLSRKVLLPDWNVVCRFCEKSWLCWIWNIVCRFCEKKWLCWMLGGRRQLSTTSGERSLHLQDEWPGRYRRCRFRSMVRELWSIKHIVDAQMAHVGFLDGEGGGMSVVDTRRRRSHLARWSRQRNVRCRVDVQTHGLWSRSGKIRR